MNVKINLDVAVGISAIILVLLNTYYTQETKTVVQEVKQETDKLDDVFIVLNNTQLNDKQQLQIIKQILKEVD